MKAGSAALAVSLGVALALVAGPGRASDHADPAVSPPTHQEAGLTGLFVFPRGDKMIVILNARRGLSTAGPYALEDYEYTIHMDLKSRVDYKCPGDCNSDEITAYEKKLNRPVGEPGQCKAGQINTYASNFARYGGTVREPDGIQSQFRIRFRLTDDVHLQEGYPVFEPAERTQGWKSDPPAFAGVRDDPFILPRFDGKNVIAMAVSIPFSVFPPGKDWLVWATTTRIHDGKQIDHVGRSNLTQLGRLDFLNTLAPNEHVNAIEKKLAGGQKVQGTIMHLMGHLPSLGAVGGLFGYVLQVRCYDAVPDVMIFTTRRPPGFPNGRLLEDDVAGLTCKQGDCVLQETAFTEGGWPRKTVNDKKLLPKFPFLAEPHDVSKNDEKADFHVLIFWLIVLGVLALVIYRWRRRTAADEVPYVRPYRTH